MKPHFKFIPKATENAGRHWEWKVEPWEQYAIFANFSIRAYNSRTYYRTIDGISIKFPTLRDAVEMTNGR